MKRPISLIFGVMLLIAPQALLAQHRGSVGGGSGAGRSPTGTSNSGDLTDFKRALALQASPDQAAQFKQVTASAESARKSAQDVLQLPVETSKAELSEKTYSLASAVEDAQRENERFLQTFSDAQKSLLKNLTKKLGKANSEITKQTKALSRHTAAKSGVDAKEIKGTAGELDKALEDLQTRQSAIGKEMGIQPDKTAQ